MTFTGAPSGCAAIRVEVFPAYEEDRAVRISFFGDEVEEIAYIDPLRGKVVALERAPGLPSSRPATT
jgi:excinuclease ABC subunit B